ncbi:MAG: DUF1858 domain-containing protein [Anaerolineae bacterium]|nr:DUF1858 domain-containing protein [Anaerolineae bacterium]
MTRVIIAPKTKISELIAAFPQLEGVLIDYVPAFEKLKNPVLRKTVARITTLQQAAAIGGVSVEELINRLREEVGQDLFSEETAAGYTTEEPAWFSEARVVAELDATGMLAAGEQPINQVIADLQALDPGDIYRLIAPFMPAPLVDKASSLDIAHWVTRQDDGEFVIYFCRS